MEGILTAQPSLSGVKKSHSRWLLPLLPLWLSCGMAILVRVLLVAHTNGVVDGDEAIVAIQAQHILHREHPIYFYGIPYFGSLEAYLIALVFALVGSSAWSLRVAPMLLSLLVVWLTWKLAAALAERAKLSATARLCFMTVAALLAAIFPLYDTVLELRTYGGYSESFILMLLLLVCALSLTQRWSEEASQRELAWRWAGIGFVVGLGLWVDPLIVSAVLAAALWILGYSIAETIRRCHESSVSMQRAALSTGKGLLWSLIAIPAGIIGCSPALYWGAAHHWENVTYILRLGNSTSAIPPDLQALYPTRLSLVVGMVKAYGLTVAPRIIGGALPFEQAGLLTTIHTFTTVVGMCCLAFTLVLMIFSYVIRRTMLVQARQLATLPLLFAVCTAFLFCTSTASVGVLYNFGDFAGRYATPSMLSLPFFFAATFTIISQSIQRYAVSRRQFIGVERVEQQNTLSRVAPHWRIAVFSQGIVLVLLFVYLCAQISTYALTDAGATFQSPYCRQAPANNAPIIAYLQHEHTSYAWASNWIGFPIMFKTHAQIVMADPRLLIFRAGINRFPDDYNAVLHANRPGFLVFVRHNDPYPPLLRVLDSLGVTYRAVLFPSQPGTDVLVVTSLSRTVSLLESKSFAAVFPICS